MSTETIESPQPQATPVSTETPAAEAPATEAPKVEPVVEAKKPEPQKRLDYIVKMERKLQQEKAAFEAQRKEWEAKLKDLESREDPIRLLKENPYEALRKAGFENPLDEILKFQLNNGELPKEAVIEKELQSIKSKLAEKEEAERKHQEALQQQALQQQMAQFGNMAVSYIKSLGDEFELVNKGNLHQDVLDVAFGYIQQAQPVLETDEDVAQLLKDAAAFVENNVLERAKTLVGAKKLASLLSSGNNQISSTEQAPVSEQNVSKSNSKASGSVVLNNKQSSPIQPGKNNKPMTWEERKAAAIAKVLPQKP